MLSEKPGNFPKQWNAALIWCTSKSTQSLHQTSWDTKTTHLHCKLCMFSRSQAAFCSASPPSKHFLWLNPRDSPFEKNIPTWQAQESKTHCSSLKKFSKIQVDKEKLSATGWNRRARRTKAGLRGVENDACSGTARLMIAGVTLLLTNSLSLSLCSFTPSGSKGSVSWLTCSGSNICWAVHPYVLGGECGTGRRGPGGGVKSSEVNACKCVRMHARQNSRRCKGTRELCGADHTSIQSKWAFCHQLKIATQ